MKSGELDRPITIQQSSDTQDDAGQEVQSWSTFINCHAKWKPMISNERFRQNSLHGLDAGRFEIRYLSGLNNKMRILFNGNYYKILSITEIPRRKGYEIEVQSWQ